MPLFTLPVTLLWSRGESPSRSPAEQQPENAAKMACGDIAPLGHGHGLQGMKVERPGTAEARQWASPAAARSAPAAAAAGGSRALSGTHTFLLLELLQVQFRHNGKLYEISPLRTRREANLVADVLMRERQRAPDPCTALPFHLTAKLFLFPCLSSASCHPQSALLC